MTETPAGSVSRPAAVVTATWLLIVGAALLLVAGMMTAATDFATVRGTAPTWVSDDAVRSYLRLFRGVGVLFSLAALALALFAARTRSGDARARRAAMALGLAIVVIVAAAAVGTGAVLIFALLSLLPIVAGVMMLNRPAVSEWFARNNLWRGADG